MTQLANKIRFIHQQQATKTTPRLTIAYHRDADKIVFAWAELYHTDEYVKEIGRQVAEGRLRQNLQEILENSNISKVNAEYRVGVIAKTDAIDYFFDDVLADHVREKMTLMDLKHSYTSQMVLHAVTTGIEFRNED